MIFKLKPILKHRLWGGNTLPNIFGIKTDDKIGEAWILSCISSNNSEIEGSTNLLDLFKKDPNIVADGYHGDFPLLIKLIDAQDDLSIQVHPKIKTEFWHVLNTKPSKLFMGLNQDTDKVKIEEELKHGDITKLLNNISVTNGDSYLIEPGTIHAIGKGTFLIEIQQSADVTYRLYDYRRVDTNGKERDLHIDQALGCINFKKLNIGKAAQSEHLIGCKYFNVYKHSISTDASFTAGKNSFNAITILCGNGIIEQEGKKHSFKPYDTFFITAGSGQYKITGKATIILTTL